MNTTNQTTTALLQEAAQLLDGARSGLRDPGLAMSWGRRRKAFTNAVNELAEEQPTGRDFSHVREELEAVLEVELRGQGLTDDPAKYDGDIHSWRCSYPDIYGACDCFAEMVRDLANVLAPVVAAERAATLRDAADEVESECSGLAVACYCGSASWLRDRADSISTPNEGDES